MSLALKLKGVLGLGVKVRIVLAGTHWRWKGGAEWGGLLRREGEYIQRKVERIGNGGVIWVDRVLLSLLVMMLTVILAFGTGLWLDLQDGQFLSRIMPLFSSILL